MQIEILMFAAARQAAGSERIRVEVDSDATAGDVIDAIGQGWPQLAPLLPACRLAIDNSYVDGDAVIPANGEIALIPPVSGG